MKKLLLFILAFVCLTSSAYANFVIPKEENAVIKFNAYGNAFGAPALDAESIILSGNMAISHMDGYDIAFMFDKDDKIKSAQAWLKDDSAAGNFLLSCMTLVSIFGDFDNYAYGMILFQYSQIKSGKESSVPHIIAGDKFQMLPPQPGYLCIFLYENEKD